MLAVHLEKDLFERHPRRLEAAQLHARVEQFANHQVGLDGLRQIELGVVAFAHLDPVVRRLGQGAAEGEPQAPSAERVLHLGRQGAGLLSLTDDGDVWWEGMDGPAPAHAIDWQGNDWTPDCGRKCAHPNARFTAPASQCPTIDPEWQNPEGVSLSAILFGGRRATTMPLVFQSRDWTHGVYVGATMGSEMTAAAFGNIGQVRRDPMAMLPFIGYHVGDYWQHWLDMGKTVANPPLIFNVNWFRKDKDGNFIWPGYGDNMRVLDWILRRAKGKAEGQKTVLGVSPTYAELDKTGLDYSEEQFNANMALNPSEWQAELESQTELFDKVGKKLPAELEEQRQLLIKSFS